MTGDHINGAFEMVGALFTWRNAWQLHRDKEIRGVYWPITGFFAAWGVWNLWYYPSLAQWWSFSGGVLLVLGNAAWVAQAARLAWEEPLRRALCRWLGHRFVTTGCEGLLEFECCKRCGAIPYSRGR